MENTIYSMVWHVLHEIKTSQSEAIPVAVLKMLTHNISHALNRGDLLSKFKQKFAAAVTTTTERVTLGRDNIDNMASLCDDLMQLATVSTIGCDAYMAFLAVALMEHEEASKCCDGVQCDVVYELCDDEDPPQMRTEVVPLSLRTLRALDGCLWPLFKSRVAGGRATASGPASSTPSEACVHAVWLLHHCFTACSLTATHVASTEPQMQDMPPPKQPYMPPPKPHMDALELDYWLGELIGAVSGHAYNPVPGLGAEPPVCLDFDATLSRMLAALSHAGLRWDEVEEALIELQHTLTGSYAQTYMMVWVEKKKSSRQKHYWSILHSDKIKLFAQRNGELVEEFPLDKSTNVKLCGVGDPGNEGLRFTVGNFATFEAPNLKERNIWVNSIKMLTSIPQVEPILQNADTRRTTREALRQKWREFNEVHENKYLTMKQKYNDIKKCSTKEQTEATNRLQVLQSELEVYETACQSHMKETAMLKAQMEELRQRIQTIEAERQVEKESWTELEEKYKKHLDDAKDHVAEQQNSKDKLSEENSLMSTKMEDMTRDHEFQMVSLKNSHDMQLQKLKQDNLDKLQDTSETMSTLSSRVKILEADKLKNDDDRAQLQSYYEDVHGNLEKRIEELENDVEHERNEKLQLTKNKEHLQVEIDTLRKEHDKATSILENKHNNIVSEIEVYHTTAQAELNEQITRLQQKTEELTTLNDEQKDKIEKLQVASKHPPVISRVPSHRGPGGEPTNPLPKSP